jgi:hypothetical protein
MLTENEIHLIQMLGDAYSCFVSLGDHHPDECSEFATKIHDLQRHVMARSAEREYPTIFGKWT